MTFSAGTRLRPSMIPPGACWAPDAPFSLVRQNFCLYTSGMAKSTARKTPQRRAGRVTKTAARGASAVRAVLARTATAGKTPQRAVRVPNNLWEQAKQAAEQRGENVTRVINRALLRYVRDTEKRQAALERFERIRANIPPEQRLPEDEALRIAAEEKAAMRAKRGRQAG